MKIKQVELIYDSINGKIRTNIYNFNTKIKIKDKQLVQNNFQVHINTFIIKKFKLVYITETIKGNFLYRYKIICISSKI